MPDRNVDEAVARLARFEEEDIVNEGGTYFALIGDDLRLLLAEYERAVKEEARAHADNRKLLDHIPTDNARLRAALEELKEEQAISITHGLGEHTRIPTWATRIIDAALAPAPEEGAPDA